MRVREITRKHGRGDSAEDFPARAWARGIDACGRRRPDAWRSWPRNDLTRRPSRIADERPHRRARIARRSTKCRGPPRRPEPGGWRPARRSRCPELVLFPEDPAGAAEGMAALCARTGRDRCSRRDPRRGAPFFSGGWALGSAPSFAGFVGGGPQGTCPAGFVRSRLPRRSAQTRPHRR